MHLMDALITDQRVRFSRSVNALKKYAKIKKGFRLWLSVICLDGCLRGRNRWNRKRWTDSIIDRSRSRCSRWEARPLESLHRGFITERTHRKTHGVLHDWRSIRWCINHRAKIVRESITSILNIATCVKSRIDFCILYSTDHVPLSLLVISIINSTNF